MQQNKFLEKRETDEQIYHSFSFFFSKTPGKEAFGKFHFLAPKMHSKYVLWWQPK